MQITIVTDGEEERENQGTPCYQHDWLIYIYVCVCVCVCVCGLFGRGLRKKGTRRS